MDHCTLPRDPIHNPIKVPYLGSEPPYRPLFEEFHQNCQWTEDELFRFQFDKSERSFDDVDPFIQSWLFFGLIDETLGPLSKHYRMGNNLLLLVHPKTADGPLVNTGWLKEDFCKLRQAFHNLDAHEKASLEHKVTSYINLTYLILRKQLDQARRFAFKPSMSAHPGARQNAVTLSITSLCTYLSSLFGLHDATRHSRFEYLEQGLLEIHLLSDGWCPSQVKRVSRALLPPSLYLISNMRRPDPHVDHDIDDTTIGRKRCTEYQCFANQVRLGDYATKHDVGCKHDETGFTCKFLAADQMQMFGWLKEGILPLALYTDKPPKLRIVPSNTHIKYVAISHVWAQGLGSQEANSLPRCQLRRLSAMVNELYPSSQRPVPFWIDTLSCPTEPEEATSLAIVQMRNTYSRADIVLILDSYLDVESARTSDAEILFEDCVFWVDHTTVDFSGGRPGARCIFPFPRRRCEHSRCPEARPLASSNLEV